MPAITNPTSPVLKIPVLVCLGVNTPTWSAVCICSFDIIFILSPVRNSPCLIRTSDTTPWYGSNQESIISACRGASLSPTGDGTSLTIISSTSAIPTPVLALHCTASRASIPIISSISSATRKGSACGKSILLSTGITSNSISIAV